MPRAESKGPIKELHAIVAVDAVGNESFLGMVSSDEAVSWRPYVAATEEEINKYMPEAQLICVLMKCEAKKIKFVRQ